MKLLIVDDHPVARRGAQALVEDALCLDEIFEAGNEQTAVAAAQRLQPDLILLDLRMPGHEPAELCAKLGTVAPQARIVIFTAFIAIDEIRACLAAGARGCVLKDVTTADVGATLRRVMDGEVVLDPRVADELAMKYAHTLHPTEELILTDRERDVLRLLADGLSNRAIAQELFLAESTVKGYVASLLHKLGADSRLQAVVRAQRSGLLVL